MELETIYMGVYIPIYLYIYIYPFFVFCWSFQVLLQICRQIVTGGIKILRLAYSANILRIKSASRSGTLLELFT